MTIFKLAVGAAALWPVLFLLASQRDHPTPPPIVASDTLAERWPAEDLPRADRLPINPPAPVAEPTPLALATAADIEQSRAEKPRERHEPARARHKPARERNICTRHGMHKRVTHGGRSWRCRR
jgi:hypothetical protein